MKKSRRIIAPLFHHEQPVEYLVDTSSWIALNERHDLDSVWPIVEALIRCDRLFSLTRIVGTASKPGEVISARDLIDSHRERLTSRDRNDVDVWREVGNLALKHRGLARPDDKKTRADPFLIALAKLDGYTVIAEESVKRSSRKIPGVCRVERIPCITINDLFEREAEVLQVVNE